MSILIIIPFYTFNTAFSEDKKYFTPLTGMEEVPPVNTNSTGIALFELLNNHLDFKVNVTNLENIKSAQIHLGEFGQNGEIIVSLLKSLSPVDVHNGTLVEGQVTPSELVGPLKGKTINELVQLFNNTKTYVNIHTEQYPNGEIRGQITTVNTTNW
ncbi:MAG TPA: CHRD domain-containing protein [Nitrososphaeraceae archaeon]